jgi:hypothetical protein
VLDAGLAERITFLPSGDFPGLRPVNGFHWRGVFYGWHDLLDRVTVRRGGEAIEEPLPEVGSGAPLTPAEVRAVIRESRRVFDETAAVFLQRAR